MKRIRDLDSRSLAWKLANDAYELRAGTELVATLQWQKGVSLYRAEAAEGRWTFKRTGIFRTKVTVRREHSSTDLVTLKLSEGAEILKLSDGRECEWTVDRSAWLLKSASGEFLIQMKSEGDGENLVGEVMVSTAVTSLPEISLLILFGWYVLVLQAKEAAEDDGGELFPLLMLSQ
jgi:hypothetical protein